jgi:hypothetical protein
MGRFDLREAIARKYGDRVDFVFVYCREAHPNQPFGTLGSDDPSPGQTHTWNERAVRAQSFREEMKVARLILVDEDGAQSVQDQFGGKDNQCIVMDAHGRIALKQAQADPEALDEFLAENLDSLQ